MADAFRAIVVSLVVVIVLSAGIPVIGALVDARDVGDTTVDRAEAFLGDTGQFVDVADGNVGSNETVYQTTGYAINFTGSSDSQLNSDRGFDLENDTTWLVSVWGHVDNGSASQTMQLTALSDGELVIYYNGSTDEYLAWYYRQSTRDSYEVAVAAPNATGNLSNVQVWANGTHLTIAYNRTVGGTTDITVSNSVAAPNPDPWDGRVEELRGFSDDENATVRDELYNNPAEQLPGTNRTIRLMFDQPNRAETLLLLAGGTATPTNVTFSSGIAEDVMQPKTAANDLAGTTDYRFERDGPRIAPTDGGELEGAPVAYVDYTKPAVDVSLLTLTGWIPLASVIPIALIGVVLIATAQRFRS